MTTVLDLTLAVAFIVEVLPTKWIFGAEFKQVLDAIKVFRNYYAERKDAWGIPQSLLNELDGYIAKFPTPYYHYTDKASDTNNRVDALMVLGKMSEYHPPVVNVGYQKRVYVHTLNPNGSIKQTFDYYANQKPTAPHWVDGVDYPDGNVKIELVWHAMANRSIRSDTRIFLKWSKVYQDWILGSCMSTPLVQDYSLYSYLRMPSEDISLWCRIKDCATEFEYNSLPVPITVSDVAPPPPLTASIDGTITGWNPKIFPLPPNEGPLKDVKVSVALLSQLTDAKGYYKISNIPVGFHILAMEKAGWRIIKAGEEYRSGDVKHMDAVMVPT